MEPQNDKKVDSTMTELAAEPDRRVPKFSNNVNGQRLPNGDIVLTFIHMDSPSQGALIERIIIAPDHAKKIIAMLEKITSEDTKP